MQDLQAQVQKQSFEAAIRKANASGGWWKGFKWGFPIGFGFGVVTGAKAR
ncbi:hypothetical protein [Dyadobacter fermentans]|nr:hypothetical protein [Dyadobacter fermentans]